MILARTLFILVCLIFILNGCRNPLGQSELQSGFASSAEPILPLTPSPLPPVTGTFNGWRHVRSLGPKTPAPQAADITAVPASVTLEWLTMNLSRGSASSYNIYRSQTRGSYDLSLPLATGISPTGLTYTDNSVTAGQTYYYKVGAVFEGQTILPSTDIGDLEVKVIVPKDNMVLLHRWAANKEMCALMGKTIDRAENYRCQVNTGVTAPPGTGGSGYLDLHKSIFVDAFEQGCNYTYSSTTNKCGSASGCIGTLNTPHGTLTGNTNDVYYSRQSGVCYINTSAGSGTTWTAANSATISQRQLMSSPTPGLPPLVMVGQVQSQGACTGQSVSGFAGTKRLLKRREQVLLGAWPSDLNDTQIAALEDGTQLNTTQACNSNYASPQGDNTTDITGGPHASLAFDNLAVPTAKDTLPGCRFGNCSNTVASIRSVRTGSIATSACVTRYGAQDLVGNVAEWSSDQINCNGTTCTGVTATSNTADTSNSDWGGVLFDDNQAPTQSSTYSGLRMQLPLGIPIYSPSFTADGIISPTADEFHGDYYFINGAGTGLRGSFLGGSWREGPYNGRFGLNVRRAASGTYTSVGFRCALEAE